MTDKERRNARVIFHYDLSRLKPSLRKLYRYAVLRSAVSQAKAISP